MRYSTRMSEYCDVALALPLDMVFTYRVGEVEPVVGGRVLVPFRRERLAGVVTALHDQQPTVAAKTVLDVLDTSPALDPELMQLAGWMARYYVAPLGEVLRTMLPLAAEVRRAHQYSLTDAGREALYAIAERGSSLRLKSTPEEQTAELRVLDHLLARGPAREATLRAATGAGKALLAGLLRRKWVAREDVSHAQDPRRMEKFVVLRTPASEGAQKKPRRNAKQEAVLGAVAAAAGKLSLQALRRQKLSASALATLARRGEVAIIAEPAAFHLSSLSPPDALRFPMNPAQQQALDRIEGAVAAKRFSVTLLHGVTGSGKTAVYLAAMRQVLEAGRSAILLVPEIGLTPAAAAHLERLFGREVAILHSALTARERAEQWRRIRRSEARIVVGTRSAVFAPVRDLALIVVDEEHDTSYKQEETPRYHGRDVAVMRGKLAKAAVLLSSATPSLESYYNAQQKKYALVELRERVEQRPLPEVEVVDMRAEFQQTGGKEEEQVFSRRLASEIRERLERSEQAIILLNRRGYAPVVLCRACGETVECRDCAIALTYHQRGRRLACHYCGYQQRVPEVCPKCGSEYVHFLGAGSEKLEERLRAEFPAARIGRLDRDTVHRRQDFDRVLAGFAAGDLDLLVGTQMIAKGHDVHGVTLVGVVGADFALGFPDFRAAERTFQLLTQVAGRAGRGQTPGRVILQTYHPEHYAIGFAARHDYLGFCEKELNYRRWMHYPPFSALANVLVRSTELQEALKNAGTLGRWLERNKPAGVRVLGPAAAPLVRLKREYRYHFLLKAESREKLNAALNGLIHHAREHEMPPAAVIVDVDAVNLL